MITEDNYITDGYKSHFSYNFGAVLFPGFLRDPPPAEGCCGGYSNSIGAFLLSSSLQHLGQIRWEFRVGGVSSRSIRGRTGVGAPFGRSLRYQPRHSA